MAGIQIIRKDQQLNAVKMEGSENMIWLKVQQKGIEAVKYYYDIRTSGCLSPPKPGSVEVYYVLKGCFTVKDDQDQINSLCEDDMFTMTEEIGFMTFEASPGTMLLLFSDEAAYQPEEDKRKQANELIAQIQQYDGYTEEHCHRVADAIIEMARVMNFSTDRIDALIAASRYHDIGKTKIDRKILTKTGKLTKEEYEEIKKHSTYSEEILEPIFGKEIAFIAGAHHERPDGKGYPRGLVGEEIPIEARMMAVADAYDAMTTNRGYNLVKSREDAISELYRCSGSQFEPECVEALCKVLKSQ